MSAAVALGGGKPRKVYEPSYPTVATGGSTRRQTISAQMAEMAALRAKERADGLSHSESERLGLLVFREQQRARYRPGRIARLRAELELLEALELAEKGVPQAAPVDLVRGEDGAWAAPAQMEAA